MFNEIGVHSRVTPLRISLYRTT